MVELLVVLTIMALLALVAVPRMRAIVTGGKVEPTASDISKIVAKIRTNFAGQGATPYTGITTAVFASTARNLASTLSSDGTTVTHDIGAPSSAITAAPATIVALGDAYTVTIPTVNDAACSLGAQLARAAEVITLNTVTVKASAVANYDSGLAATTCTEDDTNTFVFTFR